MFPFFIDSESNLTTRLVSRLMLPCILLFTIAVVLSHRQGGSDSYLSDLLMPTKGCSVPCFLGIRPGVTTIDAGLQEMRASPLIQSVAPVPSTPSSPVTSGLFEVEFSPADSSIRTAQMQLVTQPGSSIIESVLLTDTGIQLTEIDLTFGQPASIILDDQLHLGLATYVGFYPRYQLYVQTVLAVCSPERGTFQHEQQNVVIGIVSQEKYSSQRSYYPDDADQRAKGWQQQLYDLRQTDCA